jgi:hypothetical protein
MAQGFGIVRLLREGLLQQGQRLLGAPQFQADGAEVGQDRGASGRQRQGGGELLLCLLQSSGAVVSHPFQEKRACLLVVTVHALPR